MESKGKKKKKGHEEPSGKTGIKTQTYQRMDLRIWGGGGVRCDRVRECQGLAFGVSQGDSFSQSSQFFSLKGSPLLSFD